MTANEAELKYGTKRDGIVADLMRDGWVVVATQQGLEGWREEGGRAVYVSYWGDKYAQQ